MHELCFFADMIVRPADAGISLASLMSASGLYGKGVFTTIAISGGEPFLWEKHWRRLTANAAKIGFDLSDCREDRTRNALVRLIAENRVDDGRARITLFDESLSPFWASGEGQRSTLLFITTADHRPIPDHFTLGVSPHLVNSTSPIAGVKSCNYLEQVLGFGDAKRAGFDEAIRLNEKGFVTSACMANVFWMKDEKLYTPSLKTGCLAGTTREFILENRPCEEVESRVEELENAEAIYLTSAGVGIVSVAEFNGLTVDATPHPIADLLPRRN